MQATFIPGEDINSDLGVVNCARVSLHKKSDWVIKPTDVVFTARAGLKEADQKLIHYLADHDHFTPAAHPRLYFNIYWSDKDALHFYLNCNPGGFATAFKSVPDNVYSISGSLYGWIKNIDCIYPSDTAQYILKCVQEKYPVSHDAYLTPIPEGQAYKGDFSHIIELEEDDIATMELWSILKATILVKVPIFVARQVRTSQIGLAYSDLYVEGESFVFNEVSRRYVNDDPEFYEIGQWRAREGTAIKQGSTGDVDVETNTRLQYYQRANFLDDGALYNNLTKHGIHSTAGAYHIAPEQARALLPQSLYTEFYATGTLHRWAQFVNLRLKPDVQSETREIATMIRDALAEQYPKWAEHYKL